MDQAEHSTHQRSIEQVTSLHDRHKVCLSNCKLLILLLHLEQERRVVTSTAEEDDVIVGAVVEGEESIASNPGEVQSKIQGKAKAGDRENECMWDK